MATKQPSTFEGFGPDLLEFYEGLVADNSRAYWEEHKPVYDQQIAGPAKALAAALSEEFGPVKVFRPNRDVRFSKDKAPYKTTLSMMGGMGATAIHYFSIGLGGVDLAGGTYMPAKDQLQRFRALQDDERRAREMDALLTGLDRQGFSMMEEGALKTAPRGWSKDHPRIHVLRLKHLVVGQDREPGPWLGSASCLDEVAAAWRVATRWNTWLDAHVGPALEPTGPTGTSEPA